MKELGPVTGAVTISFARRAALPGALQQEFVVSVAPSLCANLLLGAPSAAET